MTSAIVQLAIGIVFVFILVGSAASFINELVAALLNTRARNLERWLAQALGRDARAFFAHPLITQLRGARLDRVAGSQAARRRRGIRRPRFRDASVPSYVSTTAFSTTLLSMASGTDEGRPAAATGAEMRAAIGGLNDERLRKLLLALLADAGEDVARFRQRVETWFAEEMDRLSGWYKRRTKWFLLLWGFLLAAALNIDAVLITQSLWTDNALRGAVVAQATQAVSPTGSAGALSGQAAATPCPIRAPRTPDGTPATTAPPDPLNCLAARIDSVEALHLPVGWPGSPFGRAAYDGTDRRVPHDSGAWGVKVLGLVVIALAAMQGGPFWFDLLGKLVNLRFTGPRPDQPPLTGPAARKAPEEDSEAAVAVAVAAVPPAPPPGPAQGEVAAPKPPAREDKDGGEDGEGDQAPG